MLIPRAGDELDVEEILPAKTIRAQEVSGPLAQLSTKPVLQRHAEAHLRTVDQCPGHMAVQHLAQQPLRGAIPDLRMLRHAPRELDDPMVEEWRARFERDGHR